MTSIFLNTFLKEISHIHAEGYPAVEMKHELLHLLIVNAVVVIATNNNVCEKVISDIQEIKAENGRVIALVSKMIQSLKILLIM